MAIAKRILLIVVLMGVSSEVGWCWGEEAIANAKERFNVGANWARDMFSGGFGTKQEKSQEQAATVMDKAGDSASAAAGTVSSAASEAAKYASNKADEVIRMVSDRTDGAEVKESTTNVEGVESAGNNGKLEEWKDAYDEALKKVGESYQSAKNTMSDKSKGAYEAAKEMASDAAGTVGSKMRREGGEL